MIQPVPGAESAVCNAALNKPAYQIRETTQYGTTYPAFLATDGKRIGNPQCGSCAVSGTVENPWWAVDLGNRMTVQFVLLTYCK